MDISSALNTSLYGLQKSSQGITQNSADIASKSLPEQTPAQTSGQAPAQQNSQANQVEPKTSITDDLTGLLENRNLASANIKALETENEVLGSLIDIKV
ncbi:hypothetical protein [Catenovulum sediminis]|uniref:Excinuclease ATPase subunit n=1 Tax=Catenovulum sediminis TaxID=1740262 RepID=A0ABV1RE29_9ALTE|nr:hypothetical protein [Catenovulum sediminis]